MGRACRHTWWVCTAWYQVRGGAFARTGRGKTRVQLVHVLLCVGSRAGFGWPNRLGLLFANRRADAWPAKSSSLPSRWSTGCVTSNLLTQDSLANGASEGTSKPNSAEVQPLAQQVGA
jgi:hypothetical protein